MKIFVSKMSLLFFAVALFAISLPNAHAQDEMNGGWHIPRLADFGAGIQGGYINSQESDGGNGFGGAHLRFRVLSFLGVEVSADAIEETFQNESIIVSETPVNLTGQVYPFGAPFTLLPWPIAPYLAGGATWVYYRTDFEKSLATPPTNLQAAAPLEHYKAPGWHAGIGVDFGLGKNVSINLEYRGTFWNFRENIDSGAVRAALPDLATNNYQLRAGLTFLFG